MHLLDQWSHKPNLDIELCSHKDFDSKQKSESAYSIYYVCETEVNSSHHPFTLVSKIYGEAKNCILYPINMENKEFFLIAPTQTEPKKLDIDMCGKEHIANYFGAMLSQAILNLPIPFSNDSTFYITISNRMKDIALNSEDFLIGILQNSFSTRFQKSKNSNSKSGLKTLIFRDDLFDEKSLLHAFIISDCMSLTRSLIHMPANILNPESYSEYVEFLVNQHNKSAEKSEGTKIEIEILDEDHLESLGCGLICAVGQGSATPPRLVKLKSYPQTNEKNILKKIALVGKGITFDSGGYGIKPSAFMRHMKKDMGGSASVLGVFFACVKLNIPVQLSCYLALAENMISGHAMRPGDIYKAYNGMLVEIDHTDAEGRLVLADALSMAAEDKPDWIIDIATLTGAARVALGPLVDPVFGNRKKYTENLEKIGLQTGDWVWRLPLPSQYNFYFESKCADFANSSASPFAGSITAALFLQKFVGSCAWNHIDSFMWCDKANGMWEGNAPTAKCVRLVINAIKQFQ